MTHHSHAPIPKNRHSTAQPATYRSEDDGESPAGNRQKPAIRQRHKGEAPQDYRPKGTAPPLRTAPNSCGAREPARCRHATEQVTTNSSDGHLQRDGLP